MEILQEFSLNEAAGVATRTLLVFIFAFLILRFLSKGKLSNPTYIDFLLVVVLGAAVSNAMVNDKSLLSTVYLIITMLIVGFFVKIVNEVTSKSKIASDLFLGDARLIIRRGKILQKTIEEEDINEETLLSLLREKGVDSPEDVEKAYLEANGAISVIEKEEEKR